MVICTLLAERDITLKFHVKNPNYERVDMREMKSYDQEQEGILQPSFELGNNKHCTDFLRKALSFTVDL